MATDTRSLVKSEWSKSEEQSVSASSNEIERAIREIEEARSGGSRPAPGLKEGLKDVGVGDVDGTGDGETSGQQERQNPALH